MIYLNLIGKSLAYKNSYIQEQNRIDQEKAQNQCRINNGLEPIKTYKGKDGRTYYI